MRHELYQGFYGILKRFVNDDNFFIDFFLPADFLIYTDLKENPVSKGNTFTLHFDKHNKEFYIKEAWADLLPIQVYGIIKNYVFNMIAEGQKKVFNGEFSSKQEEWAKNYNLFVAENDKEVYFELVDMFKEFLWNEPIAPTDISIRGCMHRLDFGFSDVGVPIDFMCELLRVIHKNNEIFFTGIIKRYMLYEITAFSSDKVKEYFLALENEKYAFVSMLGGYICEVALTEKFYEAFKKSFYYDYDPKVARPTGCIYS